MRQGVSPLKKFLCPLAGAAVLAVAAVPAVGQSPDKVTPDAVTRKTKPAKSARTYPWKLTTSGSVKKPRTNCPPGQGVKNNPYCSQELTNAQACTGKVRVTYTLGNKVVAKKTAKVKSDCSYKAKSTIKNKSLAGKRLRVQARFLGNAFMNPRNSSRRRVLLGKNSKGL
jgi:hypothetical protein